MGERQSDGGLSGRGSRHALLDADVEALIIASLIREGVDAEAEQRAVAAFRAARAAGAPRTHTRRRDDWSGRKRRHLGRSLKATLSVLLASLTLGGVAVAAIGVAGSPQDGTEDAPLRKPAPSSAPRVPSEQPSRDSHGTAPGTGSTPDRPAPAQDTEAHCRAYERVGHRGKAMEATSWQRLVAAAGGERNVTAYCAERLDEPKGRSGGAGDGGPAEGEGERAPAAGDRARGGSDNGGDNSPDQSPDDNRSKRSQPNGRHK
ncbi:hypothetical protein [Streptomyces sp. NPDC007929]|uniref:hypothetical protein n=1 Tax=unclassified Streptomyces TaxID=2593676 RepID=UPI0036F0A7D4